jgi:tetratricopeptide (TPR) repeat protein
LANRYFIVLVFLIALAVPITTPVLSRADEFETKREANEYFKEGEEEYRKGDYEAAIKMFEKCLSKDPANIDAQYNIGICRLDMGEDDAALEAFRAALEIEEGYSDAYYNIGRLFHVRHDYDTAIRQYEKALVNDPYAPDVLYNLALAKSGAGDAAGAIETWERYLVLAEGDPAETEWFERAKEYLAALKEVENTPGSSGE